MTPSLIKTVLLSMYWDRKNQGGFWIVWLIFGLAAVGAILLLVLMPGEANAKNLPMIVFSMISCGNLVLFWILLSANLARLSSPTITPLLPGATQAIVGTYAISWLAVGAISAVALLPAHVSFLTTFLFAGFGMLIMTLVICSGNWLWGLPIYLNGFWSRPGLQYGERLIATYGAPLVFSVATASLLAFFCLTIRIVFLRKGDRAFSVQSKSLKRLKSMNGDMNTTQISPWQEQLSGKWLYDRSLRNMKQHSAQMSPENARRFMAYGLGAGFHWSSTLSVLLWVMVYVFVMCILPGELGKIGQFFFTPNGIGITLAGFIVLMTVLARGQRGLVILYQTRKEQQLLCLLPFVPQRPALGRAIMALLIQQVLISIFIGISAAILGMLLALHQLPWQGVMEILQMALISCVAFFFLFPDFSRLGKPAWRGALTLVIGILPYFATGVLNHAGQPFIVFIVGILILFAAGFYTLVRWRKMPYLPAALPVGRLA